MGFLCLGQRFWCAIKCTEWRRRRCNNEATFQSILLITFPIATHGARHKQHQQRRRQQPSKAAASLARSLIIWRRPIRFSALAPQQQHSRDSMLFCPWGTQKAGGKVNNAGWDALSTDAVLALESLKSSVPQSTHWSCIAHNLHCSLENGRRNFRFQVAYNNASLVSHHLVEYDLTWVETMQNFK